ncbi:putative membrane protein (plasmid) [Caballeronia cordobensis]|nr:putative membrane protein [Burkholderia sp. RPE67]
MSYRELASRLLGAGILCLFLSACGGGDSNGATATPTSVSMVAADRKQTPPVESALPTMVSGFNIQVYSHVDQPMKLSFGPDGALYVGRQGGNNRIHRIAPEGSPVSEFGPPMVDPDAVLFDATGRISGTPNSILVGGGGILAAIFPNQTATVVFNTGFADVDDMKFDGLGRLIFSDDRPRILTSSGSTSTVLISLPIRAGSIAVDRNNRIFLALADGTISIYKADGTLEDSAFATGLAGLDTYLAFGPGAGGFGHELYVLNGSDLFRFDTNGKTTLIGSGFSVGPSSGTGFVFGPDKALYVSEYSKNRILKISRGN